MALYTSHKRLVGKVPGQITSSGTIAGLGKKGTVWYEIGQTGDGQWLYSTDRDYSPPTPAPEPTPAPTPTPTPAAGAVFLDAEMNASIRRMYPWMGKGAGLHNAEINIGANGAGCLGTFMAVPPPFVTDLKSLGGVEKDGARLSAFLTPVPDRVYLDDLFLQGRALEFFGLVINGQVFCNAPLGGLFGVPGAWLDPGMWSGERNGVRVDQIWALNGLRLSFKATLTNTTRTILPVGYMRGYDPDQDSDNPGGETNFNTTNRVTRAGEVESTLIRGGKVILRSSDAGVKVGITKYNAPQVLGPARAIGVSKTGDEVLQLIWPSDPLAPGASRVVAFEYEFLAP